MARYMSAWQALVGWCVMAWRKCCVARVFWVNSFVVFCQGILLSILYGLLCRGILLSILYGLSLLVYIIINIVQTYSAEVYSYK